MWGEIRSFGNVLRQPPPDMIISLLSPADMLKILRSLIDDPAGFKMRAPLKRLFILKPSTPCGETKGRQ